MDDGFRFTPLNDFWRRVAAVWTSASSLARRFISQCTRRADLLLQVLLPGLLCLVMQATGWAQASPFPLPVPPGAPALVPSSQTTSPPSNSPPSNSPLPVAPSATTEVPPATAAPATSQAAQAAQADLNELGKRLDDLKARVDASAELTDEQKKTANDFIEQGRADLAAASEFSASFAGWQKRTEEIEAERQKSQASLEAALREKPQFMTDLESLPKLEQALASKQQDLVNAQNELAQAEKRQADRPGRQKAIKDRLAAIPGELENANNELNKLGTGTETSLQTEAKRLRFLLSRHRLENETPALQAESAFLSARDAANINQLSRQEWTARVARAKEEVNSLQREVLRQKSKDAESRRRIAEEDAELTTVPEIRKIYETNMGYVEEEIQFREKEKRLKEDLSDAESLTDWINQKHKDLENRKGKIGSSKSFGIRLRTERRLLPNLRQYREELTSRVQVSQDAQLNLIELTSQVSLLSHMDSRVNLTMTQLRDTEELSELSDEKRLEISQLDREVRRAYEQQQKYLTELQHANEAYVSTIDALDAQQTALIAATESFQKFIDENILWVPTSNMLTLREIFQDSRSLRQLFNVKDWTLLGEQYRRDAMAHPSMYVAAILAWLALFFSQRWQRDQIRALGQKASSRLNTAMQPTWLAIFWTVVKALVLPFPFFFLSWRGQNFSGNIDILSRYVFTLTVWLYWLEIVRITCRDRGLGVAHFQWPERVNQTVMVQLSSFIALATPIIFVVAMMQSRTADEESLPVERVCSVAFFLLLAYSLYRLTSRKTGILREWIELHPGGWLDRLASFWNVLAVSLPLFLAGLTIAGYIYAAEQLSVRLAQTLMLVFAALSAKSTFVRWLTLRQRRLAIEHAREVRAALAESKGQDDNASTVKLEAQEARTNLVEVSMQSKRLLNTSVLLLSLACLWYIWIDVLPALKKLDEYSIPYLSLSFAKVLTAAVIAILFTTAARNIPGLQEMLLLERLPLDRSVRYAIGALTRYVIVFMGIMTIGHVLGYRWEDIQWLIAALTFGLGFGLQEIFANFVSGLIILFEQPVRVGDVVTIDSVTGTVSKIRMRSTTIVDWDNKEYIVPNKGFITDRLLNWTLSDTTNRITLNVGASYQADPTRVRELLLKIVRTQPLVMSQPGPAVVFEGFNNSALNFVIRAYLPSMDSRTETMTQLYFRIHREFAAAGIEIPYPQQGLHLRSSIPIPFQQPGKSDPVKSADPDDSESESS